MMNKVILVGRTTDDVKLNYTKEGKAVANVDLAVQQSFVNKQTGKREADFIRVVIWGKPAETLANFVKKGNTVGFTGRISTRNFEGQDGKKVYVTEVLAEELTLMPNGEKKQA